MKKTAKGLPESLRQTITVAAPLLVVIVLFLLVGNFGVSKILGVQAEIDSAQKSEKTLTQKLSLLQTLSTDAVLRVNVVGSALPDTNPALTLISQLKNVALANGVFMTTIKSSGGSANTTGLNEANISFSLEGTRDQIFTFLTAVSGISPITIVNNVSINESLGSLKADVSVKSFWAVFPKTIPDIISPIDDLTANEKRLLTKISGLTQPKFTEIAPTSEVNPNPFGQ